MISWQESVNYDPIGDCCRADRNKEFWQKQSRGHRHHPTTPSKENQTSKPSSSPPGSAHRLLPGCKIVKPEERARRLAILKERNRRMYER